MPHRLGGQRKATITVGLTIFLLSATIFFLNSRWLLAQGYQSALGKYLTRASDIHDAVVAADWAVRLSPYDSSSHTLKARLLARQGYPREALAEFEIGLKRAESDPFLWQNYARLKCELGQFDQGLLRALKQVVRLAPRSLALHLDNADLAMRYWHWGNPDIQAHWAYSVQFVVSHKSKRFQESVLIGRREDLLCTEPLLRNPRLDDWCRRALLVRKVCTIAPGQPGYIPWCKNSGWLVTN